MKRAYLSNLSPLWPWHKQEALLLSAVPTWPKGIDVLRDELDSQERRGRRQASLVQRDKLLRPSTRRNSDETILLPSLAVFDWTVEGVLAALAAVASRGATVRVLDCNLTIAADAGASVMGEVAKAFAEARMRQKLVKRGEAGGKASAEARWNAAAEKLKSIEKLYRDPQEVRTDAQLANLAGVSVNTMKEHLGPRPHRKKIKAARAAKEQI